MAGASLKHEDRHGTGVLADRESDTRQQLGMEVEWDARIINEIDNEAHRVAVARGFDVSTAGTVNLRETGRSTEVRVRLQYNPPAGKLWAAIAWLFGEEPTMQIQEDLQRFKQLMETGKISENRLNG